MNKFIQKTMFQVFEIEWRDVKNIFKVTNRTD